MEFFKPSSPRKEKKEAMSSILEPYFDMFIAPFMTDFLDNFRGPKKRHKKLYENACLILFFSADKSVECFEKILNEMYPSSIKDLGNVRGQLLLLNKMSNGCFTSSDTISLLLRRLYNEKGDNQRECGELIAQFVKTYFKDKKIPIDEYLHKFKPAPTPAAVAAKI